MIELVEIQTGHYAFRETDMRLVVWFKAFFRERARRRKVRSILTQIGWVVTRFDLEPDVQRVVVERLIERIRKLETH